MSRGRVIEKDIAKAIGASVLTARMARGISQSELATLIGTKQPAVSRIEQGHVFPSMDMLIRMARVLKARVTAPRLET